MTTITYTPNHLTTGARIVLRDSGATGTVESVLNGRVEVRWARSAHLTFVYGPEAYASLLAA